MKKKNKILVIAEAGVNHNGSLNQALKMIDTAIGGRRRLC